MIIDRVRYNQPMFAMVTMFYSARRNKNELKATQPTASSVLIGASSTDIWVAVIEKHLWTFRRRTNERKNASNSDFTYMGELINQKTAL